MQKIHTLQLRSFKWTTPRVSILLYVNLRYWTISQARQTSHPGDESVITHAQRALNLNLDLRKLRGRCHKNIGIPNFWHPRSNVPRICGTPIPIFLRLRDSTFDLPPENWHPQGKHVNANVNSDWRVPVLRHLWLRINGELSLAEKDGSTRRTTCWNWDIERIASLTTREYRERWRNRENRVPIRWNSAKKKKNVHADSHAWTINEPHLPYKTGLDVMQSHPLRRTRFGQYQASSAALGWPGDGDCYNIMRRMQSGDWPYSKSW